MIGALITAGSAINEESGFVWIPATYAHPKYPGLKANYFRHVQHRRILNLGSSDVGLATGHILPDDPDGGGDHHLFPSDHFRSHLQVQRGRQVDFHADSPGGMVGVPYGAGLHIVGAWRDIEDHVEPTLVRCGTLAGPLENHIHPHEWLAGIATGDKAGDLTGGAGHGRVGEWDQQAGY